ncbi:MAG: 2-C-methyl-D-erythritol 4-phosphate cytidylyltransferase [Candidatus Saccharicenans sp.]|jgi:2-C-methyl-D-erythritol 4-phosphate cytidylyltransferase|nr:2-C-methyl-D-erythritol 4-phosphate cytidylyltransferase [Candidatus Saccharicenans sp.]
MKTAAIILGGGQGRRSGFPAPKQFLSLGGQPLLDYSVEKFLALGIDLIVAVLISDYQKYYRPHPGIGLVVPGGQERQASVLNGLKSCPPETELVIIHDAARPFFPLEGVKKGLKLLEDDQSDGLALAIPAVDTLAEVVEGKIVSFPDRQKFYQTQTPQLFRFQALFKAYQQLGGQMSFTDDLSVAYAAGLRCGLVEGSEQNFKITTGLDWEIAGRLIKAGF